MLADFTKFRPESRIHDPAQLVVWNVEEEDSKRRFRSLFQGNNVLEVFDARWGGKTMDQVIPGFLKSISLHAAHECASSRRMIYSIVSTFDEDGRRVDCERLLLPFGSSAKVEQIVSSLQLISIEGDFSRKAVLDRFACKTEVILAGKIDPSPREASSTSPESHEEAAGSPVQGTQKKTITQIPKRRRRRLSLRKSARLNFQDSVVTCLVSDISTDGARLHVNDPASIPDSFLLTVESETAKRQCKCIWRKDHQLGVAFIKRG